MGEMVVFFQHFVAWKSFEICKLGIHKVGMNSTFQGILSLWFIRPWLLGHFLFGHEERYLKGTHLLGPWVDRLCIDLRPVGFCSTYICFFFLRDGTCPIQVRQCSSLYALAELAANASTTEESAWTEMESNVEKEQLGPVKGNPTPPNSMNLKMDAPPLVEEEIPNLEAFLISGSYT